MNAFHSFVSFSKGITKSQRSVVTTSAWLFFSETLGRVLKFILVIYAARMMGTEAWGVFSYALSMGALIILLGDLGLQRLITREIAQNNPHRATIVSHALILKGATLIVGSLIFLVIAPTVSAIPHTTSLFIVIALFVFFDSLRDFFLAIHIAVDHVKRDTFVKLLTHVSTLIVGVILLMRTPEPLSLAIAYGIGSSIGCLTAFILLTPEAPSLRSTITFSGLRHVMQLTSPFAVIALLTTILGNIDIYLLGLWTTVTDIGLYSSALRIHQFITIIPTIVAVASFPFLSRLARSDTAGFTHAVQTLLLSLIFVALPISMGGILFSGDIIRALFGIGYSNAIPLLQLLMISSLMTFPLILLSNSLLALHATRDVTRAYALGLLVHLSLSMVLIPHFGVQASIWVLILSTTCITLLFFRLLKKNGISIRVLKHTGRSSGATLIAGVVVYILQSFDVPAIVSLISFPIVYISILIIRKEPLFSALRSLSHQPPSSPSSIEASLL